MAFCSHFLLFSCLQHLYNILIVNSLHLQC
nr:MAG TPA: hypothetical protein [Caudoviricetes sp.]